MSDTNTIVKYTKLEYELKIQELQQYHDRLDVKLTRLKTLKEQVSEFWNDKQARDYNDLLKLYIDSVDRAMQRTQDLIDKHNLTIKEMGEAEIVTTGAIKDIASTLIDIGIK